jgi:hypothetical protein
MKMKEDRKPFMSLDMDVDDEKLEKLAATKGVGVLVKPEANGAGEGAEAKRKAPTPANGATPRSRMKTVNLELPDYVWTDLKIRAAKEQVSLRHIVMTALRDFGVEISESDMIQDGRRMR